MLKRLLLLLGLLLIFGFMISAQEVEPEATSEVTAEVTSEVTAEVTPEVTPEATAAPDDADPQTIEDPECPELVSTALNLTQDRCEDTGINEACYGYVLIESQGRNGESALEQPGDIVPLLDIETLQLSSLDTSTGQWGVLEIKLEANVLDDDPNSDGLTTLQDLQFIVFGDTQITDSGQFVQVTPQETLPVYQFPDIASEEIDQLESGLAILASARLVGDEWVRIPVDLGDGFTTLGWIEVANLTFENDLAILPELTQEEAENPGEDDLSTSFGPMQAFVFRSGLDDAPCSAAPNSGMLIQTPEGVASVTIVLDEVVIQMSGTGFVQAQADGEFRLDVLDGEAQVTSDGDTRTAIGGQSVSVELDENGVPIGAPNDPQPLDLSNTQGLPTNLLDDEVEIADPFDLPPGVPVSGQWGIAYNASSLSCPDGTEWPFVSSGGVNIQAQQDGLIYSGVFHSEIGVGSYQGSYPSSAGDEYTNNLQVNATDRITGSTTVDFAERLCTLTVPFTLQLQSAN